MRKETRCRHIGYSFRLAAMVLHHPTDRIAHTTAFVTPVVEHWLEREIAQWVHPMNDRSHHERTLLPRSYISHPPLQIVSNSLTIMVVVINVIFVFVVAHEQLSCKCLYFYMFCNVRDPPYCPFYIAVCVWFVTTYG